MKVFKILKDPELRSKKATGYVKENTCVLAALIFLNNCDLKFRCLCIPSSPQWKFDSVFLFDRSQVICAANTQLSALTGALYVMVSHFLRF